MKCVCPMGGDRTCPDDCPLSVWQSLPPKDRKAERKPIAERLYKQGFTQEAIATQLGVSQYTISKDLEGLLVTNKPPRPKGGRPKRSGPKPQRQRTSQAAQDVAASLVLDQGKTYEQAATESGVNSVQIVKTSVAREEGRREPQIDRNELSLTAQQKVDAAIRQYKRNQDLEFETRVRDEVKRRIDEVVLPHWKEKIDRAQELYSRRKALMDKATFNKIRRGLHPDSRNSISDKMLGEAFDAFMALEKFLLNEKDSPTEFPNLPQTWADWEKAKQAATAARRARRGHSAIRPR